MAQKGDQRDGAIGGRRVDLNGILALIKKEDKLALGPSILALVQRRVAQAEAERDWPMFRFLHAISNRLLFGTGIQEEGAYAITLALAYGSPSLTRLNLQYNALRGDVKKELDAANAARATPVFLVM